MTMGVGNVTGSGNNQPSMVGGVAINYGTDQNFTKPVRALFIVTAGTLHFMTADGSDLTIALTAGWHHIRVKTIYNAGSSVAAGFAFW